MGQVNIIATKRPDLGSMEIFTHGVKIISKDDRLSTCLFRVLNDWAVYTQVKEKNAAGEYVNVSKLQNLFGAWIPKTKEFWLQKGQLKYLETELRSVDLTLDDLPITKAPLYKPSSVKFQMKKWLISRDYQEEAKQFVLEEVPENDVFSKLVAMPTGTGKTFVLCSCVAEASQRVVIGVLPKYAEKWAQDLSNNLDVSPKQIMMVQTIDQLRGVIHVCKEEGYQKIPPLLVITLTTISGFIEKYLTDPKACIDDMGCAPTDLWRLLNTGIFAIDEAHEHLHKVFMTSMFLHGPKFIALSGTMRSEDPFQEKVQNTVFPRVKRFLKVKMEKYIDVEFIEYSISREYMPRIKYQAFGRSDYSHNILENSIMKIPRVMRDYIQMTIDLIRHEFVRVRKPDEKAGIYVASVEMSNKFVSALTQTFPDLNVVRYCASENDKYEDLMKSDIYVSTIQSAGTAVDIPMLTDVVCTTLISSSKANLQTLGRLRKLPNLRKVTMYMPYCRQIPKHHRYTEVRKQLFSDITKSMKTMNYTKPLGA